MHNAMMIEKKKQAPLLSLMSTPIMLFCRRGKTGTTAISFMQHVVRFCGCFLYFVTEFNINSLLLSRHHTKCYNTITHSTQNWL
jgi:hypothetical protein